MNSEKGHSKKGLSEWLGAARGRRGILAPLVLFSAVINCAGGLEVLHPAEGAAAPLVSGGVLELLIELGTGVRVPAHGHLAVFVDGELATVLCPQQEVSLERCPGSGPALEGQVKVSVPGVRGGERFISAEILDKEQVIARLPALYPIRAHCSSLCY